jgi:hypothetical protein
VDVKNHYSSMIFPFFRDRGKFMDEFFVELDGFLNHYSSMIFLLWEREGRGYWMGTCQKFIIHP